MEFTQSILLTIKKMLGIAEEYHAFDIDILTNINAVFLTLNQLGVGPDKPYQIRGEDETWQDFLGEQYEYLAAVQTYVYQRVRLLFDPPTNSFLVDAIQKSCQEFEWRFTVQPKNQNEIDHVNSFRKDYDSNESSDKNESTESLTNPDVSEETEQSNTLTLLKTKSKRAMPNKPKSLYDIFS